MKEKIAEAKGLASSVTESETYKTSHSSLAKPVFAAGAAAGVVKAAEVKKEEKAEAKEEKKEEKVKALSCANLPCVIDLLPYCFHSPC